MLGEPGATAPMGRAGLEALAARFPDYKDDPDG